MKLVALWAVIVHDGGRDTHAIVPPSPFFSISTVALLFHIPAAHLFFPSLLFNPLFFFLCFHYTLLKSKSVALFLCVFIAARVLRFKR